MSGTKCATWSRLSLPARGGWAAAMRAATRYNGYSEGHFFELAARLRDEAKSLDQLLMAIS